MTAQRTMVYRAAVDGDTNMIEIESVKIAYQIVELEDNDSSPDGWFRTTNEISAAFEPAPKKAPKIKKPVNDEVSDDGVSN